MIAHLTALAHSEPSAVGYRLVHGHFPETIDISALAKGLSDKPSLKRFGDDLLIIIPGLDGNEQATWCAWLFDHVPPVNELPALIDVLSNLGKAVFASSPDGVEPVLASEQQKSSKAVPSGTFLQTLKDLSGLGALARSKYMKRFAESVSLNGVAKAAFLVHCKSKKCGSVIVSDQSLIGFSDEVAQLVSSRRKEVSVEEVFSANSEDEDHLLEATLAEAIAAENLHLFVPALNENGIAIVLVGAVKPAKGELEPFAELANLGLRQKKSRKDKQNKRFWQIVSFGAILALGIYLLMPAKLIVTASALSLPQTAQSVNLSFDSYLQEMNVDVGDKVTQGDELALMTAPGLEARHSEVTLQISVQEMSGKAALAQNDYGSYQLAMQKLETQKAELTQIEQKLDQLSVRAPLSGTVIRTLGRDSLGRHVSTGQPLVIIQPDDHFAVALTLSDVDAPLVKPGQKGAIFFRGLSDRTYSFTVQTPVYVETNEQSQAEQLVAKASIDQPGEGRLIAGLSGFARLEAGSDLHIFVLTRYAVEFIKVKAWTYLGLHF
nr:efflux RND transporter periplasmic adaptor subunit [uncultured Cohaesibacter sp.]